MKTSEQVWSCDVNAPKQQVWRVLTEDKLFREWTAAFCAGAHFVGDWTAGSRMRFLSPEGTGLLSTVSENVAGEKLYLSHIGDIRGGKENLWTNELKNTRENYDLSENNGVTTVRVTMDVLDEYQQLFAEKWPDALARLKTAAEQLAK